MHAPTDLTALHDAALARALELRQQALDEFFSALGSAWRRLLGSRVQPEA
jgi:hypothetical protein